MNREDVVMSVVGGVIGLLGVLALAGLLWATGYWVGLYDLPCAAAAEQPHCVKAGWGTHNDVELEVK